MVVPCSYFRLVSGSIISHCISLFQYLSNHSKNVILYYLPFNSIIYFGNRVGNCIFLCYLKCIDFHILEMYNKQYLLLQPLILECPNILLHCSKTTQQSSKQIFILISNLSTNHHTFISILLKVGENILCRSWMILSNTKIMKN